MSYGYAYGQQPQQPQQQPQQQQPQAYATSHIVDGTYGQQVVGQYNQQVAAGVPEDVCRQWWRWVIMVLAVVGVGLGVASHILVSWGTQGSSVSFGVWQVCVGSTCTGSLDVTAVNCPSGGLQTRDRYIIFVAMAVCGVGFAFISWVFVWLRGDAIAWCRHVSLICSVGGWVTAVVMWWQASLFLDCFGTGIARLELGLAFWLAIGAGFAALFAFLLSIVMHAVEACCGKPAAAAAPASAAPALAPATGTAAATTGGAAGYAGVTGAVGDSSLVNFTDLNQSNGRDPASVGLEDHWYYDDASGYWWSDKAQLYYDAATEMYGQPPGPDGTPGLWYDPKTGEWS
jgi:hypothetical protein